MERFARLGAYAFDLGIFQQAVWLMAQGETPFVTVRGMNILGDHFTPILYLFVPFYRLWAHPFWLFLGQTIALAAGAFPLFRLALRTTGQPLFAALLAVGYLLHPALFTMLLFDFHPVLLAVPFLLWAMEAMEDGRWRSFAVAAVGAAMCKEEVALAIACLSLYGIIVKRYRWAWWGLVVSIVWLWAVLKIMAHLSGGEKSAYLALYARWGETPLGILWGILSRPLEALQALIFCQGHATAPGVYPLLLLTPFAFFPLFAPEVLLFGLPNYALIALNERVTMRELGYQYASLLIPWLAFASVSAVGRLVRWGAELTPFQRRQWYGLLALTWVVCVGFGAYRYGPPVIQRFNSDRLPLEEARRIAAFIQRNIPPDASVSAPTTFVPLLAHRRFVYLFPNPFQQVAFGPSVEALKQQIEMRVEPLPAAVLHQRMRTSPVDFVLLKGVTNCWPLMRDAYDALAVAVLTCSDYGVVAVQGDLVLLQHKADFRNGLRLLGVEPTLDNDALTEAVAMAWQRLKGGGQ